MGLRDARLSEKLQLDAELTLAKALAQACQCEAVKVQQGVIRGEGQLNVDAIQTRKLPYRGNLKWTRHQSLPPPSQKPALAQMPCTQCGRTP